MSFVKQLLKIVLTIVVVSTILLYELEVFANYSLLDIIPTVYSNCNYQQINCLYNSNFHDIWDLPSEIFNVTNNDTLIVTKKTISPLFTRIETNNYKYAIFCSNGYKPRGTGNALAIYWTARAIAFFMNWTFVMNNNTNDITKCIDTSCSNKLEYHLFERKRFPRMQWTWFLQMEYNTTIFNMCNPSNININLIALKYNYLWKHYTLSNKPTIWNVPYWSYLMLVVYNPWFVQIVQHDTANAFKQYYSYNKNDSISVSDNNPYWIDKKHTNIKFYNSRINEISNTNQHVIVIHIRCGDLLYHGYRYLLNMQYFMNSIDMILNYIKQHDDFNKFYKFRVISQLTKFNAHSNKDVAALELSNKLVHFMCDSIGKYINYYYNINHSLHIIGNGTTDNDYFEMATTKYVICSPSSFCFTAVIANYYDPQLIILPQIGAWLKQKNAYIEVTNNTYTGLLSHHKWIETPKSSWILIGSMFNPNQPYKSSMDKFKQWFVGPLLQRIRNRSMAI